MTTPVAKDVMKEWREKAERRHAEQVADGLHDSKCEFGYRMTTSAGGKTGPTFMHMCHCAKRRREAAGFTEPPGALMIQHPMCPKDYVEVDFDGDYWVCPTCGTSWGSTNEDDIGQFMDDYGDCFGRPLTKKEKTALGL